jgi:hypothetical protein
MALNEDTTLYNKAFEKNIVSKPATPATLRIIDSISQSKATGKCF